MTTELTKAATDVLAERARQIEAEGYDAIEDDENNDAGQLGEAAACYATRQRPPAGMCPPYWPGNAEAWKPKDRRSDLVRAGALILAEIERLDRATERAIDAEIGRMAQAEEAALFPSPWA